MNTNTINSTTVQLRISPNTKDISFNVFKKHGLTLTDGIRIYLERVAKTGEIPFSMNIPNEKTAKVLVSSDYIGPFETVEDLFADLEK